MKKLLAIFIITILLSSCVVSRKEYEKLNSEKYNVAGQLHEKNKELHLSKIEYQKEIDSIIKINNEQVALLELQTEELKYKLSDLESKINDENKTKSEIALELNSKDSIISVCKGKLQWVRKLNRNLKTQLATANEEKQIINELLVKCKNEKVAISNDQKSGSSSLINYQNKSYSVFVSSDFNKVKMGLKNKDGESYRSIGNLLSEKKSDNILYACNGGMYLKDNNPQGLYIQDGKLITEMDEKQEGYGNFYMQPNGVFVLTKDSAEIVKSTDLKNRGYKDVIFATQSGPMLIIDGNINSKFSKNSKHLNIRNGVGVNDKNEVILVKSETPVSFYEMARLFKEKYNCKNALYLDGVISRAYLPEIDKQDLGGNFGVMIYVTK